MKTQNVNGRGGIGSASPGPGPHPAKEGRSVSHPIPKHPRWCSNGHCLSLDDTLIHRSEPRTVQSSNGAVTVGWFRIDVDDIPGTVRLEVLPDPPAEQVAA